VPDWFDQNAPPAPAPAAADDWFSANAPGRAQVPTHPVSAEDFLPKRASSGWPATIGDVLLGGLKGAGSTVAHLGEMAVNAGAIPGVLPAGLSPEFRNPIFQRAGEATTPTNTAQKVGKIAEQIGEVVLPTKAASLATKGLPLVARMAAEGAINAGLSSAQGGNPLVAGAVGAALPGVGSLIERAAPALRASAEKQVVEALGPTKERFKAMAERLTPEILRRGLRGSREQIQQQAAEGAAAAGDKIDAAIQQFGGREVDPANVVDALESAKNAFRTSVRQPLQQVRPDLRGQVMSVDPNGIAVVAHEFEPRAIRQLEGLQQVIKDMGPSVRADQLIAVRRAWDKVVDQAGGFAHRAGGAIGVPLADQSEAAAKRAATSAIREQLNATVPELTDLNKEYSFWKSLDDVTSQTLRRTQSHGPSLTGTAAEAAGSVVGAAAGLTHGPGGAISGAFVLGKLGKMAQAAFNSPKWKMMSAGWKDDLASAIVNDDAGKMATLLARVGSVEGSKIGR
jgi:hypothetical protein